MCWLLQLLTWRRLREHKGWERGSPSSYMHKNSAEEEGEQCSDTEVWSHLYLVISESSPNSSLQDNLWVFLQIG